MMLKHMIKSESSTTIPTPCQVAIPCRPQKTFTLFVHDIPDDLPEEDIRFALYKFNSVVEVVRLVVFYQKQPTLQDSQPSSSAGASSSLKKVPSPKIDEQDIGSFVDTPPSPIRITLASVSYPLVLFIL